MNPSSAAALLGRLLLGGMFLLAGIGKFGALGGTAGYIASAGLPAAAVLAPATAAFEVLAGLALIVGWQARWAALALALFTLAASLLFHAFWAAPADRQFVENLLFQKNMAIVGGLLIVFALGGGAASLDARRRLAAS